MTEEQFKQLQDDNFIYLMLLGYASSILIDARYIMPNQSLKIDWLLKAIENKIYLQIPIPPMP